MSALAAFEGYSSELDGSNCANIDDCKEEEAQDKDESLLRKKYDNLKVQYFSVCSSECNRRKKIRQLESEIKAIKKESQRKVATVRMNAFYSECMRSGTIFRGSSEQ